LTIVTAMSLLQKVLSQTKKTDDMTII
jgi:hypothetical protein